MILRGHALRVVSAIVVLSISACGSSKSGSKSTSTTTSQRASASAEVDAAFKTRAVAVCKAAGDALRAQGPFPFPDFNPEQPDASKFPTIAVYESKTVGTDQSWQSQLHALGQPSTGVAGWNTFLALVDGAVTSTIAQQDAARRGDSAAFTQTYHDLSSHGRSGTEAANAVGLPSCDPSKLGG